MFPPILRDWQPRPAGQDPSVWVAAWLLKPMFAFTVPLPQPGLGTKILSLHAQMRRGMDERRIYREPHLLLALHGYEPVLCSYLSSVHETPCSCVHHHGHFLQ